MKINAAILEVSCFIALLLAIVTASGVSSLEKDCNEIKNDVFRLHVIANSDSKEDQELKLSVRDAILKESESLFSKSTEKESAEKTAEENLGLLLKTAEDTVKKNGFDYPVSVSVGKSRFPTKTYSGVTLPAGEYDALRIVIGNGEGKNWWCVMFPPLCLSASEGKKQLSDVLSDEGFDLVQSEPKYEIRFWIVEKIEELRQRHQRAYR